MKNKITPSTAVGYLIEREDPEEAKRIEEKRLKILASAETPENLIKQIEFLNKLLKLKDDELSRTKQKYDSLMKVYLENRDLYYALQKKREMAPKTVIRKVRKILKDLQEKDYDDWEY